MISTVESPPRRGRFIVIEGVEGAGKTTVIKRLRQVLLPERVVFTHAPGGEEFAEMLRKILFDEVRPLCPEAEYFTFLAALTRLVGTIIRPAMLSGKHVVCDRFDSSTYAHQIYAQKVFECQRSFGWDRRMTCAGFEPDLYIFLDIDPEISIQRALARGDANRFDRKEMEYHRRVYDGYREFFVTHPHEVVDAKRSPDEVFADVFSIITQVCT